MKSSTLFAVFIYLISLLHILDWIIFWNRNKEIALNDNKAFKQLYYNHFPEYIKPILTKNSRIETFVILLLLIFAGYILFKEKRIIYKIVGINAYIIAAWYLFSLM